MNDQLIQRVLEIEKQAQAISRVGHLTDDIVQDLFGAGSEEFVAGRLPGVGIDAGQL